MGKRTKSVFWAMGIGLAMTIATYFLSNLSFPISSENTVMKWAYQLTSAFRENNKPTPDSLLFINTAFDRELVDIRGESGFEIGNIDITDRGKLVELLKLLRQRNDYKYIVMDLRFEDGMDTPHDTLLIELINNMPRLVIPKHARTAQKEALAEAKMGYADFSASISEGDFTKYVVCTSDASSMAYHVYNELTGHDYSSFCGLYFSEGRLMRRAMYINLDINPNAEYDADGYKKVYYLGSDILADPEFAKGLFVGKIIYVGDFSVSDMHPTYKGAMAGAAIHANAVADMFGKKHLIGWWTFVLLWLSLSFAAWIAIIPKSWADTSRLKRFLPARIRGSHFVQWAKPLLYIVLAFVGYGTLMTALFFLIFLLTGQIYEIIGLSILLVIIGVVRANKKTTEGSVASNR